MEADMKSVSVGTKSKAQVLEGCLQQMKACFLDVSCSLLSIPWLSPIELATVPPSCSKFIFCKLTTWWSCRQGRTKWSSLMQWEHSLLGLVDPFDFLLFLLHVYSFTLTILSRSNRPINETQNTIEVVRPCGACNDSEMLLKRRPVNCLPVPLFISSGNWDVSCLAHAWALLFLSQNGGFMVGCRGFPQCRNVVWLPGSLAEAAVTQQICPTCVPGDH